MDRNYITNLISMLEEYYRLDIESWSNVLLKVNRIYDKYGDINYIETENNLSFIDKYGEFVEVLY